MARRENRRRYGRGWRAAPIVVVAIGSAVSGCQSDGQNHVMGAVATTTSTSTTPPQSMVHGVVALTSTTSSPATTP